MDALVAHLEAVASPADRIAIAYGDLPLIFHTALRVQSPWEEATLGRTGPAALGAQSVSSPAPRFFVPRHFHPVPPHQLRAQGIERSRYREEKLGVPDYQWNHRPDPLYHRFTASGASEPPPLRIYVLDDAPPR